MSDHVVFDIETGPLPIERLKEILPGWDASSIPAPGVFDPNSVKTGNLKDESKIAEKIWAARKEYEAACDSLVARREAAEAAYWADAVSKAALSALTGRVYAMGARSYNGFNWIVTLENGPEETLLSQFWNMYLSMRKSGRKLVGFNSKDFDVPFLIQRSVILGVDVPSTVWQNDRYLDSTFVDLRDRWGGGSRAAGSLDMICRAAGIGSKPEGVNGAMFHKLFDDEQTRPQAIEYLRNDLAMTWELSLRLMR